MPSPAFVSSWDASARAWVPGSHGGFPAAAGLGGRRALGLGPLAALELPRQVCGLTGSALWPQVPRLESTV